MEAYFLQNLSELAARRAISIREEAQLWDILSRDLKREGKRREETPKRGAKGLTIFVRTDEAFKTRISVAGTLDILTRSLCVMPPSIHPVTNKPYVWIGTPLYNLDLKDLPYISVERITLLKDILVNEAHRVLMSGQFTHDAALKLTAVLSPHFSDDQMVISGITAFFPKDYQGDTQKELPEMLSSARQKKLGRAPRILKYDPGTIGPRHYNSY